MIWYSGMMWIALLVAFYGFMKHEEINKAFAIMLFGLFIEFMRMVRLTI